LWGFQPLLETVICHDGIYQLAREFVCPGT
jgi:hypothetical protein